MNKVNEMLNRLLISMVVVVFVVGSVLGMYASVPPSNEIDFNLWFNKSTGEYEVKSLWMNGTLPLDATTNIEFISMGKVVASGEISQLILNPKIKSGGGFDTIRIVLFDGTIMKCEVKDAQNFPIYFDNTKKLVKIADVNCLSN